MDKPIISIDYLTWVRPQFHKLLFYFMDKIKPENKKKIKLNILATSGQEGVFAGMPKDIVHDIVYFPSGLNYPAKNNFSITRPETYSIKLDEDILMSNYMWDFIIENIERVDDAMLMSPILSANIPYVDEYMRGLFTPEERKAVEASFLKVRLGVAWGVDYSVLNKHTIDAEEWNPEEYWNSVKSEIKHPYKGIHPLRVSSVAHDLLNGYSLNHLDKIFGKNYFRLTERNMVYFTNSFFAMRTDLWKEAPTRKDLHVDPYDEVPISLLMHERGLKALAIENGYAMHLCFNNVRDLPKENKLYRDIAKVVMI